MYWAALSTDIKKSSVNWNGLPLWMEKAVQYHNTLLESCVEWYVDEENNGTTVELLPNAPEGDAYTYLFTNSSLRKLRQFVIDLGLDIQRQLNNKRLKQNTRLSVSKCDKLVEQLKEEKDSLKNGGMKIEDIDMILYNTYNLFQTKKYYGGIYILIGIAFSDQPPIPYTFNRYRGQSTGEVSKSYRGGVITMAEKAEEKADYDLKTHVIDKANTGNDDQSNIITEPVLKECYMEDGTMKFKDVFHSEKDRIQEKTKTCDTTGNKKSKDSRRSGISFNKEQAAAFREKFNVLGNLVDKKLKEKQEYLEDNGAKSVTGFCVFVEYHPVLSDALASTNPYTKTLINQEYIDIHNKANRCIDDFIGNTRNTRDDNYYKGGLVKQKRDSTSMFVILQNTESAPSKRLISDHTRYLYETLSKLLTSLPVGSSIGIAYGDMKELEMDRAGEGTFMDYFQASVNLAARMVMRSWSFSTKWGITDKNNNHNRIAFTSKDNDLTKKLETNIEVAKIPFTLEHIPLSALNAGGSDTILCISSRFTGWKPLKVGDNVKRDNDLGEIMEDLGDEFVVKFKRKKTETVKRSNLTLVGEQKTIDQDDFEKFKLKL